MKTLLTFLFLLFSSFVFAEDISEFEIEGISVGDSLLDYYSENQILNMDIMEYKKQFNVLVFRTTGKYDLLQFTVKKIDKKYKIYALEGLVFKKINNCLSFKKNIVLEVSDILGDEKNLTDFGKTKHNYDKSGKSYVYSNEYKFDDGSQIKITCYHWSDEIRKKENWIDNFRITMNSYEFVEFNKNVF